MNFLGEIRTEKFKGMTRRIREFQGVFESQVLRVKKIMYRLPGERKEKKVLHLLILPIDFVKYL